MWGGGAVAAPRGEGPAGARAPGVKTCEPAVPRQLAGRQYKVFCVRLDECSTERDKLSNDRLYKIVDY